MILIELNTRYIMILTIDIKIVQFANYSIPGFTSAFYQK